jgi:signal transduction histidine kinase
LDRTQAQCIALAADLRQSRAQLLREWHRCVDADPELTTASSISAAQFTDNVPRVLDAFEQELSALSDQRETQATQDQREGASEHGLQRWQQGYDLRETMREWGHLHRCLLAYLENYTDAHPELEPGVMRRARAALVSLCADGACESAARYSLLQQAEAAGRMRDLRAVVQELRALERQRVTMLREAAHDLRGSVGVISSASAVLSRTTSEEMRQDFYKVLDRGIHSARSLLSDLIDLTRLEAGQDQVRIDSFNVSEMLRDIGESLRVEAAQRGLFLKMEGPASMLVTGDRIKIQRIVQNLSLNAFKATTSGGVTLSWEAPASAAEPRWTLTVADTGPGMQGTHATPLTQALSQATEQAHQDDDTADELLSARPLTVPGQAAQQARAGGVEAGEGIGLSIVKRLCELLGIAIELQSAPDRGTVFRLSIPVAVAAPPRATPPSQDLDPPA